MSDMFEKLAAIEQRFLATEMQMAEAAEDYQRVAKLAQERSELEPVVTAYRAHRELKDRLAQAESVRGGDDPELVELALQEIEEIAQQGTVFNPLVSGRLHEYLSLSSRNKPHAILRFFASRRATGRAVFISQEHYDKMSPTRGPLARQMNVLRDKLVNEGFADRSQKGRLFHFDTESKAWSPNFKVELIVYPLGS